MRLTEVKLCTPAHIRHAEIDLFPKMLQRLLFLCFAVIAFAASHKSELHLSLHAEPKTLDPLRVTEEAAELVRYIEGGTLVHINRGTDHVDPDLADSWQSGDGGRSLTFHLRPSLRFSDGTLLTTNEVRKILLDTFDVENPVPAGDPFRSGAEPPQVSISSPQILTIRFPKPRPDAERLFDSLSIAHIVPGKLPASSGPFYISEYHSGEYLRLARNPWYWKHDSSGKQLPYLDSIRLDIQSNREIELHRLLKGDLDVIGKLEPEAFAELSKTQAVRVVNAGPSLDSEFLWFNQIPGSIPEWKRRWYTSTDFRNAISLAIDRPDLARIAYRGAAHPAVGPVSAANTFWVNHELPERQHDPALAAGLLTKAGFRLHAGDLYDMDGHKVEFSIITNAGNHERESMATLIQQDLGKLGIRLNIVTLDFASLIDRIMKTHQYEAGLLGFTNVEVNPSEQANIWLSSGAMHAWWPSQKHPETAWEARIDELEISQATMASREQRKKAFDEVQRIIVEQEPMIFLVNPDSLAAVSTALQGVQAIAVPPQILWNVERFRFN